MKIDVGLRSHDLHALGAEAAAYERLGVDGLWSYETAHDPFLPLFAAALTTERVSLGTAIAVAFGRSPFVVAQTAWDLQRASGGRLLLGLGTQVRAHIERRFSAEFDAPRRADRRLRPLPPGDLGHVPERHPAGLRGPVLSLHADQRLLQPRPDRAPGDPDLARRGRRAAWPAPPARWPMAFTSTRCTARGICATSCGPPLSRAPAPRGATRRRSISSPRSSSSPARPRPSARRPRATRAARSPSTPRPRATGRFWPTTPARRSVRS